MRRHAALKVEVLEDHAVSVALDEGSASGLEFREQLRREALQRERDVRVLEGVGHPTYTVVVLHEEVLVPHRIARGLLRGPGDVADQLEDVRERGEREDDHHQATHPGRDHEGVR